MNQEYQQRFLAARRGIIARRFKTLNDMQRRAVLTTQGPLLLWPVQAAARPRCSSTASPI